ncbi:MAG: hypothetical protein HUU46_02890 [Candidatus Hydrogenedentes bacterium]|nr:hypothetical protein [Candidatus Hydrogenedentota bacterium]
MKKCVAISCAILAVTIVFADEGHEQKAKQAGGTDVTVTGEILDMACYIDHGAMGADHADCAKTCIESGLPVGIKGDDGKTYLLIGEHKPINKSLIAHAGKTITVRGKAVSRDGFNMIENTEIVPAKGK